MSRRVLSAGFYHDELAALCGKISLVDRLSKLSKLLPLTVRPTSLLRVATRMDQEVNAEVSVVLRGHSALIEPY